MEKETWKQIELGTGRYAVSDQGNVMNMCTGRVLNPYVNGGGYACVTLHWGGVKKVVNVHRLVAEMFVLTKGGPEVIHLDCDKLNNVPSNLKWVTKREGMLHYWKNKCEKIRQKNMAIELEVLNEKAQAF